MEVLGIARCSAWSCPACLARWPRRRWCSTGWPRWSAWAAATSSTSIVQGGTPGAYLASFTAIAQVSDIVVSEIKAFLFGFTAGVVASYRGLNPPGGPRVSATR